MRLDSLLYKLGFFIFPFILFSCANVVAPSGGPKDTTPPEVIAIAPANYSTNFRADKIELEFNEFVFLKDPKAQVLISPSLPGEPNYKVKGKRLIISLPDSLEENTTYTFNFGESLRDVNEGNVIKNFSYTFSTGKYLDSMVVKGKVIDAFTYEPVNDVVIALYKDLNDSVIVEQKPFYFTRTETDGSFRINNVKQGIYQVTALKDENYNLIYDLPNEKVGFINAPVEVTDSIDPITISLFEQEHHGSPSLIHVDESKKGRLVFVYSKAIRKFNLETIGEKNYPDNLIEFHPPNDTVIFWYTYNYHPTQEIRITANDSIVDTVEVKQPIFSTDSIETDGFVVFPQDQEYNEILPTHYAEFKFNSPVYTIDNERIIVYEDTIVNTVYPEIIQTESKRELLMSYSWKPGKKYGVIILDSTITDYYGRINDTIFAGYYTKTVEEYASLALITKDTIAPGTILQLLGTKDAVIREIIIEEDQHSFNFHYLNPGDYQVKLIFDTNSNKKWDSGNYWKKRQPEKTYLYPEKINLRANWEVEVELSL